MFAAPQAYIRLNGRVSFGGNEVWLSLEGNSLTIDLRRLGGRTLLQPAEALREFRDLIGFARSAAAAGYTVSLRVRGLKIMSIRPADDCPDRAPADPRGARCPPS
ncbi:MAG: hypothetical protein ACP5NG_00750 [Conexivisphaera sp.]